MDPFEDLCIPILEGIGKGTAFDIVIPRDNYAVDLNGFGEYEEDDDDAQVKSILDVDGCRVYAQLLSIIALVVELRYGMIQHS